MTPSTPQNLTITVHAIDLYFKNVTRIRTALVQVQNALSGTIVQYPADPVIDDGTSKTRLFTWQCILVGSPTNIFYMIDYGDGTPVLTGTYMPNNTFNITHLYKNQGIYNVDIIIYNKIGNLTAQFQVS
jgi:hypothetical protein